jgi:NAD(P)-dependent dehydrogenase (short-subunit alcohol dehydrogenase family)
MESPWKRAIVVGASSGMGEAIARRLAREGCQVALAARREEELNRIAGEINAGGTALARVYPHDVREYECVPALFQQITHDLGGLDLIVYASGVMPAIAPDEYSFEKDRAIIEVNVLGAIAWLNEAAQRFERARAGTIVGISSVAGERGRRGMPAYGASKAALATYLESLRNRLGRYGVAVVTIKPGPVETPMTQGLGKMPLMIPADTAAAAILAAARRQANTVYVPGAWRWIFLVIRTIPSFLFRKMNF